MGNPWGKEEKKVVVPRFYVHTINFLLIIAAALLILYLYKSYAFKQLDLSHNDLEKSLKEKDAVVDALKKTIEDQKTAVTSSATSLKTAQDELRLTKDSASKNAKTAEQLFLLKEQQERAVKYACLSSDECRDIYVNTTMQKFIITHGLNVTGLPAEPRIDYYQFFLAPVEVPEKFTFDELTFIKQHCVNKWYETPGLFVTRFNYKVSTDESKKIQVVMNDRSADVLCAWMFDTVGKQYSLIQ